MQEKWRRQLIGAAVILQLTAGQLGVLAAEETAPDETPVVQQVSGIGAQVIGGQNNNIKGIGAIVTSKNEGTGIGVQAIGAQNSQITGVGAIAGQGNYNTAVGIGVQIYQGGTAVTETQPAVGYQAVTGNGVGNQAIGAQAAAGDGHFNTALGAYAQAGGSHLNTAIGAGAMALGGASTAIGAGSAAVATNSVAVGAGSVADRSHSVSVGASGAERQITNVAPGTAPTDAVNMSQLNNLGSQVDRLGATAFAFTALAPLPYRADEPTQYSVGIGSYNGQQAVAFGIYHYTKEDVLLNAAFGLSSDGFERAGRFGITWRIGGGKKQPKPAAEILPPVRPSTAPATLQPAAVTEPAAVLQAKEAVSSEERADILNSKNPAAAVLPPEPLDPEA